MRSREVCKLILCLLLLSGCVHPWQQVLITLNQPSAPARQLLNEDLYQLNQAELESLKTMWQPQELELRKLGLDKKALRLRKLKFFHEKTQEANREVLASLENPAELGQLTFDEAQRILDEARHHQVAGPAQVYRFARANEIGFCFGRALLIHYSLLRAGVPQNHIAKIFNLGELKVENTFWHFHVAVIVNSRSGYWILDPLHPQPMSVEQWVRINQGYDVKAPWSQARFYITDPRKFMPSGGQYEESAMKNSVYGDYFKSLIPALLQDRTTVDTLSALKNH
ncbi:hypothetical protein [Oligoflexus tunisiensis]|uniref:hypothetical protein n=1 Tax=Oligoflexus tunisiensis TaxID=708132 RepID=UPI00114CC835|nr:hypothetical protein [Oligoflexus tunisiensis]